MVIVEVDLEMQSNNALLWVHPIRFFYIPGLNEVTREL